MGVDRGFGPGEKPRLSKGTFTSHWLVWDESLALCRLVSGNLYLDFAALCISCLLTL